MGWDWEMFVPKEDQGAMGTMRGDDGWRVAELGGFRHSRAAL